jgi:hypothetical protein
MDYCSLRKMRRKLLHCLSKCRFAAFATGLLLLWYSVNGVGQQTPAVASGHETIYKYDTPGIKVEGTLIERRVYGPPGYGETPAKDKRDTNLVLKLRHEISVEAATNAEVNGSANLDPAQNVREIQLFVDRAQVAAIRKLIGREIVACGTLNESITASQYTKVWLDVKALEAK